MKVTRDIYLLIMAPRAWMGQSVHNLSLPERNSVRYSHGAYMMKHVHHRRFLESPRGKGSGSLYMQLLRRCTLPFGSRASNNNTQKGFVIKM